MPKKIEAETDSDAVPMMRSVPLDDGERADRARKLAKAVGVLVEVEADAKKKKKALKGKVDEAEAEVVRLAEAVNSGVEKISAQHEMFDAN